MVTEKLSKVQEGAGCGHVERGHGLNKGYIGTLTAVLVSITPIISSVA